MTEAEWRVVFRSHVQVNESNHVLNHEGFTYCICHICEANYLIAKTVVGKYITCGRHKEV